MTPTTPPTSNSARQPSPSWGAGRGAGAAIIATISFIAAVAFSIAGFLVPPLGDLTEANLYLVAQYLLVTTSIFGVGAMTSKYINNK